MLSPAMMAFGEHRNRIDMAQLEHLLELLLGESAADAFDRFGSMEIEMNLSESHGYSSRNGLLSSYDTYHSKDINRLIQLLIATKYSTIST